MPNIIRRAKAVDNSGVCRAYSGDLALVRGRLQSQAQRMVPGDAAVAAEMHTAIWLMAGFERSDAAKRTNGGEGSGR